MTIASITEVSDNAYLLKGVINHESSVSVLAEGMALFTQASGPSITVDLRFLENPNTVCAALLVVWKSNLMKQNKTIIFTATPEALHSVMKMSNINQMMDIE